MEIPKEFGGKGDNFCPDELFVSSIGGCLLTTLLWLARRLDVKLSEVKISVEGIVEGKLSGYEFSGVRIEMFVKAPSNEDVKRVERLVDLAKDYCHITKALSRELQLNFKKKIDVG
ncbi:MAG: OsmC family protein [Candidatus Nezhaarchaeales archaeon]